MVVLHEVDVDAELAPGVGAEGLDQEAAVVAVDLGLEQDEPVEPVSSRALGHQLERLPYWRS